MNKLLPTILLASTLIFSGCSFKTIPKAGMNSTGAAVGAVVGGALGFPTVGASIGAGATTFASEELIEPTVVPLPTDIWSLVGYTIKQLEEVFFWLMAFIIGLPMLLTYLMPNGETRSLKKVVKESVTNTKNLV